MAIKQLHECLNHKKILVKSLSENYHYTRDNPVKSEQFSARRFTTDISKNLPTAYVKYYLLSIQDTILFCFKSKIIEAILIFFYFMKQYTQRAYGVKTDACEGNSGRYSFFLNGPEKLVFKYHNFCFVQN